MLDSLTMIPFRMHHILQILNSYEIERGALDLFISQYFKNNRALGSKDRKEISTTIYALYRHLGKVNALSRRPLTWENRLKALKQIDDDHPKLPPHVQVSFPQELFQLIANHYGESSALEICKTLNTEAPITLRANEIKCTREELIATLSKQFRVSPSPHSPWAIHLEGREQLFKTDAFKEGLFEIQDEASQLAAALAGAKPGEHILDFCAGAGGKSLAMAPNMDGKGQIYLHDVREKALLQAKQRLKRAGAQNIQITLPGSKNLKRLTGRMDCVFVDAPCTGTGTYRRHPEQKWRFNSQMLGELVTKQRSIFESALTYMKPTGRIVYATCSILNEENMAQIEHFLKEYDLAIAQEPLQILPKPNQMDGFFTVVCKRKVC